MSHQELLHLIQTIKTTLLTNIQKWSVGFEFNDIQKKAWVAALINVTDPESLKRNLLPTKIPMQFELNDDGLSGHYVMLSIPHKPMSKKIIAVTNMVYLILRIEELSQPFSIEIEEQTKEVTWLKKAAKRLQKDMFEDPHRESHMSDYNQRYASINEDLAEVQRQITLYSSTHNTQVHINRDELKRNMDALRGFVMNIFDLEEDTRLLKRFMPFLPWHQLINDIALLLEGTFDSGAFSVTIEEEITASQSEAYECYMTEQVELRVQSVTQLCDMTQDYLNTAASMFKTTEHNMRVAIRGMSHRTPFDAGLYRSALGGGLVSFLLFHHTESSLEQAPLQLELPGNMFGRS